MLMYERRIGYKRERIDSLGMCFFGRRNKVGIAIAYKCRVYEKVKKIGRVM